jgi:hypothetical protein
MHRVGQYCFRVFGWNPFASWKKCHKLKLDTEHPTIDGDFKAKLNKDKETLSVVSFVVLKDVKAALTEFVNNNLARGRLMWESGVDRGPRRHKVPACPSIHTKKL